MMLVCVKCGKEMLLVDLDIAMLTEEEGGRLRWVLADIYFCECGSGVAISKSQSCRIDKKEEIVEELFYL